MRNPVSSRPTGFHPSSRVCSIAPRLVRLHTGRLNTKRTVTPLTFLLLGFPRGRRSVERLRFGEECLKFLTGQLRTTFGEIVPRMTA